MSHLVMKENKTSSSHVYLSELSDDRLDVSLHAAVHLGLGHKTQDKRDSSDSSSDSSKLQGIFSQIEPLLDALCGGNAANTSGALPDCSWETAMKAYILTYD